MFFRFLNLLRNYLLKRGSYRFFIRNWIIPNDLNKAADVMSTMRHVFALQPQLSNGPKGRNIIVIAPHPDDEVIGPGGTLIRAIEEGAYVTVIFLTNGGNDREVCRIRKAEAEESAKKLGFSCVFLNIKIPLYPLGEKGRNDLIKILKAQPIEVLFIPFLLDDHPDHRNTNALLMEISEKSTLNIDAEVWAYQVYTPLPGNMVVDITNQIDQKKVSIEGYASQMRKRNWAHFALGLNAFNTRLLNSSTDERFVEAFFVVPFKDYIDLCRQYFRRT